MIGMLKRKAEKVIIDTALKGLKKRVESLGPRRGPVRIILFTGKGGVGKTTAAAGTASSTDEQVALDSAHERSNRCWASTCCTNSRSATAVGSGPTAVAERVGQRVRGVGGEHQRALPGASGEGRRTGRRGGLADAALAGEQDDPHGTARQPSDSTRFLRPLSAVSMMTFSALRLSMPIIGMEMSTASR